ncbi:MAG: hypothetical protein LUI87_17865 [Lachnospiraceae bacterium]|nr:hypothetical protein [Lachnospiraceae bacterium]
MEKGMKAGMDKGMAGRLVRNVDSLMKNEGYSMERACRSLDSTVEEYEEAKKILSGVAFAV